MGFGVQEELNTQILEQTRSNRSWVGYGLIVLSALGFSVSTVTVSMAFRDGLDINTANAVRHTIAAGLLFILMRIRGRSIRLVSRQRFAALGLGLPLFLTGFGYLGAIQYIPVSVAVLIFYTFPLMVALISRIVEQNPITFVKIVAILSAFIGLALALGVDRGIVLDWRGIAFALLGAVGAASLITISNHALQKTDTEAMNLHAITVAAILFVIFAVAKGGSVPEIAWGGGGKVSLAGIVLAIGFLTMFAGIARIGSVKSAMLLNVEPLMTIGLAVGLLAERLTPMQVLGAILVTGAIILITRRGQGAGNTHIN